MHSYLYALIQKSEFGPLLARAKPRRGILVFHKKIEYNDVDPYHTDIEIYSFNYLI